MLIWLIALILLAVHPFVSAVCPAAKMPAVVAGGMVIAPRRRATRTDFGMATRFGRDTARNGPAEAEGWRRLAEGAGCGDGGSVTPARVAAVVSDLRAAGIAEPAAVDPLTVAQMP